MASVFVAIQYRELFDALLSRYYENTFSFFKLDTIRKDSWGNNFNILAISLLFDRTIVSFSYNSRLKTPYRYKFELKPHFKRPMTIGFYDSHFAAILPKDQKVEIPCTDSIFDFLTTDFFFSIKARFC